MQAAVYLGPRQVVIQERQATEPAPGQVQIEVAYTGICGTDLHIFHGDMDARVTSPAILGHEMSGRVAALGPGVTGWRPGQPVTVMPLAWCGSCPACIAMHRNTCHRLDFIGIDSPGSMQGRWVVPESTLVALPEDLALREAALIEPVAVAVHDVRRGGLAPAEHAVVVGGGPVGVLIAAVAAAAGGDVVVVEPAAARREVAERLGITALDPASVDVASYVQDWTSGAGAAVSFEASGVQAGIDTAVDVLAVRGRLVQVAIHPLPRRIDLHRFFWRELDLLGARLYGREDVEHAVELVAGGVVPVAELISRVVPLRDAAEAFAALEHGGVMKVLVDCTGSGT